MFVFEVLICKGLSIDGFPACSVAGSDVASLDHKALDYAVKWRPFVMQWFALYTHTLFSCAQRQEIRARLRGLVCEELRHDPPAARCVRGDNSQTLWKVDDQWTFIDEAGGGNATLPNLIAVNRDVQEDIARSKWLLRHARAFALRRDGHSLAGGWVCLGSVWH